MAKRLRTLASVLWDTDSPVDGQDYFGLRSTNSQHRELQLENNQLKLQVEQLLSEVNMLKSKVPPVAAPFFPREQLGPLDSGFGGAEKWIHMLRQDVVGLPRLHEEVIPGLLESLYCKGSITFDLPKSPKATAYQVTQHAERCVANLSNKYPAVFKIGITSSPVKRWIHPVYGYSLDRREHWQGMKIISITSTSFSAALIETMLISRFKGTPGCRNEKPGGESASPGEGPHFTYVVYRVLFPPPRIVSHGAKPKLS